MNLGTIQEILLAGWRLFYFHLQIHVMSCHIMPSHNLSMVYHWDTCLWCYTPAYIRSGQDRSGQVKLVQVRSGQVKSGQVILSVNFTSCFHSKVTLTLWEFTRGQLNDQSIRKIGHEWNYR